MGNAKGYIHHVAEGANFMAAARADADVAVAVVTAAVAAGAVGVGGIGVVGVVVAAVVVAGAAAVGVGVATAAAGVAGIFALVGAAATKPYENFIPEGTQITCRRIGAGLLAAFTIACGGGAGYAVSQKFAETNDNQTASTSSTPLQRDFSVQVSGKDNEDCTVTFSAQSGTAKIVSGSCSVKEPGLSVK